MSDHRVFKESLLNIYISANYSFSELATVQSSALLQSFCFDWKFTWRQIHNLLLCSRDNMMAKTADHLPVWFSNPRCIKVTFPECLAANSPSSTAIINKCNSRFVLCTGTEREIKIWSTGRVTWHVTILYSSLEGSVQCVFSLGLWPADDEWDWEIRFVWWKYNAIIIIGEWKSIHFSSQMQLQPLSSRWLALSNLENNNNNLQSAIVWSSEWSEECRCSEKSRILLE